jgi:alkylated DNA nucleotide flippase Atl1
MSYQPNLFIRNIGNASVKVVHELISNFQFGKIAKVEILYKKKETCAIVKMEKWDTKHTECTRIMLSQGKPISLYYTENECWKAYAHKDKEIKKRNDEQAILAKKREIQKKKDQAAAALLLLEKQKKEQEEILNRELSRIAEECRLRQEQEMREQWRELDEELKAKQVILDYGNIAKFQGHTKASKKLQALLKKLK